MRASAKGYTEGLLRKSVVGDPFRRVNTGDNTPAILHVQLVPGDTLKLTVAPKGFGSENMSQLKMLTPADGLAGVKRMGVANRARRGRESLPAHGAGHRIGRRL